MAKELPSTAAVLFQKNLTVIMNNNNTNFTISKPENSPSEDYLTRDLGRQFRIFQHNMERIGSDKSKYLERLLQKYQIDVVMLQETHVSDEQQLLVIH